MHNRYTIAILFFMLFFNTSFAQDSCFTQVLSFEDPGRSFISNYRDSLILVYSDKKMMYVSYDRGSSFIDVRAEDIRGNIQKIDDFIYREYSGRLFIMDSSINSWLSVNLPYGVKHFAAKDTSLIFALTDSSIIVKLTDYGLFEFDNPFTEVEDIEVGNNNELFVFTREGKFYTSTNLGATWNTIEVPFDIYLYDRDIYRIKQLIDDTVLIYIAYPPEYYPFEFAYKVDSSETFSIYKSGINENTTNVKLNSDSTILFVHSSGIYEKQNLFGDSNKVTHLGYAKDACKIDENYFFIDGDGIYKNENCDLSISDDNYYSLEIGNQWLYFRSRFSMSSSHQHVIKYNAVKDTVLNGKQFTILYGKDEWLHYNRDSQELIEYDRRFGTYKYIMNFNYQHKSYFFPSGYPMQIITSDIAIFGDTLKAKGFTSSGIGGGGGTYYASPFGYIYGKSSGDYGSGSTKLVEAIIHDGDSVYHYHNNVKPEIRHHHDSLNIDSIFTFETEISHSYATMSSYLGKRACLDPFIDSAWIELKYMNSMGDSVCMEKELVFYDSSRVCHSLIALRTDLLENGYECRYRIHAVDKSLVPKHTIDPADEYYTITYDDLTGIENTGRNTRTVYKYELYQNYPNPFNAKTVIAFDIPSSGEVRLRIYDLLGRVVAEPVNEVKSPGSYEVLFNADELASGMYFYELKTDKKTAIKKMILLK